MKRAETTGVPRLRNVLKKLPSRLSSSKKLYSKTSPAGELVWSTHRTGYYFSDAELDPRIIDAKSDPRIIDELAIPRNQRTQIGSRRYRLRIRPKNLGPDCRAGETFAHRLSPRQRNNIAGPLIVPPERSPHSGFYD